MNTKLNLAGEWQFILDGEKRGISEGFEKKPFDDHITLPGTTAYAKKGAPNKEREAGHLTEVHKFEGFAWYRKKVKLPIKKNTELENKHFFLTLERTRISTVWVDGKMVGVQNSFIAKHVYDLTKYIKNLEPEITIMVSNVDYIIAGGHMTSPDTQTNWNGILGEISLEICDKACIEGANTTCDFEGKKAIVNVEAPGFEAFEGKIEVSGDLCSLKKKYFEYDSDCSAWEMRATTEQAYTTDLEILDKYLDIKPEAVKPVSKSKKFKKGRNEIEISVKLPDDAKVWDEEEPYVYRLKVKLCDEAGDVIAEKVLWFGLRQFKAAGRNFTINGRRTFLRGRHQGLLFPLSGFAPMNAVGWLKDMKIARDFGINHERCHTCVPPEAAFIAADLLGIYLEPELPFWGNWYGKEDKEYNDVKLAQEFLTEEGFNTLKEFAGHPSFVMMSMGNELWGNPGALNELEGGYKAIHPDICYTQGSNNFQWNPNIQPNDDFFTGVRFTKERQIRGSYAMCDAPQGPVQKGKPSTNWNYDRAIKPPYAEEAKKGKNTDDIIEIQYGTGVKSVRLSEVSKELIPEIPVVSHEIGQYFIYPDYDEITKYTGALQARNLEIFQERLEDKSLSERADDYFKASGVLAMQCYKSEIEAALRSNLLAGFQMLDLQDYSGQGTALVGPLNALMQNKGLITAKKWREFCSSAVVLGKFDSYVLTCGEKFDFNAKLAYFSKCCVKKPKFRITLTGDSGTGCIFDKTIDIDQEFGCSGKAGDSGNCGLFDLGSYSIDIPDSTDIVKYVLRLMVLDGKRCVCENFYFLWAYERVDKVKTETDVCVVEEEDGSEISFETSKSGKVAICSDMVETDAAVDEGKSVLFYLSPSEGRSLPGAYCTDFWNYTMFKNISESMGKPIPVGTLGLLIDNDHPALGHFKSEYFTTPQWYEIIERSRSSLLNWLGFNPIVTVIDNCESNDNLGLVYELMVMDGKKGPSHVLVCTSPLRKLAQEGNAPAAALERSLLEYLEKDSDIPGNILRTNMQQLRRLAY
jgi:hypothetical protein